MTNYFFGHVNNNYGDILNFQSSAVELSECKTEYYKLREMVISLDEERKMGDLSRYVVLTCHHLKYMYKKGMQILGDVELNKDRFVWSFLNRGCSKRFFITWPKASLRNPLSQFIQKFE